MPFIGKVILITGANGGVGAACALYFAKKGALLALVGRNADKFDEVTKQIQECGVEMKPLIILADVCVDAERIIRETIDKYGHLDILINNAGFNIPGTIESSTMDDYDAVMATNTRAVFELTKLAVPYLIETKGNIVNVSSISGIRAFSKIIVYSMSKAALDQFTLCLALDLGNRGVRVNSVNPGFIDTDFHKNHGIERGTEEYTELVEQWNKIHPIGRVGLTEDCVNAIALLADESASFVTGVIFPVDGGLSATSPF